jgi:Zn-finger protein
MSGAFEVGYVYFGALFSSTPLFPLGSDFSLDYDQELKERSCHKSLFIHHESGVCLVLPHQRALVEEANKRLSKKSAEADELRVITTVLKEEVA